MRIAIEIRHPAQVHLFRNLIAEMTSGGHQILVLALKKESSLVLLEYYGITFKIIGKNRKGLLLKLIELIRNDLVVLWHSFVFRPDLFIGHTSPSVAHASFLMRKPYLSFSDTEHAELIWKVALPFMTRIVTPDCFLRDMGVKQIRYRGYHELAYLHPDRFTPDEHIRERLGLSPNERFAILRFVSWEASHDLSHAGIGDRAKRDAIRSLEEEVRVFVSSEGVLPDDLRSYQLKLAPHEIHHVLAAASLFLGDSSTMAAEAAILGTPAVYVSTLACKLGYIVDLADTWDLLFYTDSSTEGLNRGMQLVADPDTPAKWACKRKRLLEEKTDVTSFMINLCTSWKGDFHT